MQVNDHDLLNSQTLTLSTLHTGNLQANPSTMLLPMSGSSIVGLALNSEPSSGISPQATATSCTGWPQKMLHLMEMSSRICRLIPLLSDKVDHLGHPVVLFTNKTLLLLKSSFNLVLNIKRRIHIGI